MSVAITARLTESWEASGKLSTPSPPAQPRPGCTEAAGQGSRRDPTAATEPPAALLPVPPTEQIHKNSYMIKFLLLLKGQRVILCKAGGGGERENGREKDDFGRILEIRDVS